MDARRWNMAMAKSKLALYRQKRDFTKTGEPSGEAKIAPAAYPRFVIQKHAATRLHYDLRLEVDGVFKSWAVTKGPSLDPVDKRLAVETEDHPLDYGDFEGTIPKGEYGGGTVMLWDRGFWAGRRCGRGPAQGRPEVHARGREAARSWVLVRMRHDRDHGKRHQLAPDQASRRLRARRRGGSVLTDEDRSVASGRSMEEIAAGKGRGRSRSCSARSGGGADAVWLEPDGKPKRRPSGALAQARAAEAKQRAREDAAAARLHPAAAVQTGRRPPAGEDWVHEIKLDGYRMQLRVAGGRAVMRTRKGLDWTGKFAAIAEAHAASPDCIIDGEVVALDHNGAPDFAALQAALSEGRSAISPTSSSTCCSRG